MLRDNSFPLQEICDPNEPEEFAVWALVALPKLKGAPLLLPVPFLKLLSKRLHDLGFRHHPEHQKLKYRMPPNDAPNVLMGNPGRWVDIDEPDPEKADSMKAIVNALDPQDRAALRKHLNEQDDGFRAEAHGPTADADAREVSAAERGIAAPEEEWREIPGVPGHYASTDGRIRRKRILTAKNGEVTVKVNGRTETRSVSELIRITFGD